MARLTPGKHIGDILVCSVYRTLIKNCVQGTGQAVTEAAIDSSEV